MPALRQEPGKLIERTWTTRGADGRKVRHTALGYDLTVNGKRERKFSSAWLTEQDVLDALARRRRELGQGLEPVADWTLTDLAREYLAQQESRGRRGRGFEARLFRTRLIPRLGSNLLVPHYGARARPVRAPAGPRSRAVDRAPRARAHGPRVADGAPARRD
jgi:hypothetical protein